MCLRLGVLKPIVHESIALARIKRKYGNVCISLLDGDWLPDIFRSMTSLLFPYGRLRVLTVSFFSLPISLPSFFAAVRAVFHVFLSAIYPQAYRNILEKWNESFETKNRSTGSYTSIALVCTLT